MNNNTHMTFCRLDYAQNFIFGGKILKIWSPNANVGSILVMCECTVSAQCIYTHYRQVTGSYADQFSNVIYLALWPHSVPDRCMGMMVAWWIWFWVAWILWVVRLWHVMLSGAWLCAGRCQESIAVTKSSVGVGLHLDKGPRAPPATSKSNARKQHRI